jgi:hypothetical protein
MGASDLTTDVPGNAEVVDDGRPAAANGANGHVTKKRKKQKALAAVAANGHVGKVAKRKLAGKNGAGSDGNEKADAAPAIGAVLADDRTLELPADEDVDEVQVAEVDEAELARNRDEVAEVDEADGVAEVGEVAGIDEVEGAEDVGYADELESDDAEVEKPQAPADGSRRARRRAAKRVEQDGAEPKLRRRAAKRAAAARRATPAGRRAELVATAASIAAAAAADAPAATSGRVGKVIRRLVALIAILMVPGAAYALVVTDGPVTALPQADAAYLSQQLITADQRVRKQLVRLRPLHTSPAIARTRESQLTARSIALEIANHGGAATGRLERALKLEAAWLDAVGSVLSNPRSPLRVELVARDAALRPALDALPSTEGLRRKGGSENLRAFAESRVAAKRHKRR